MNTHPGSLTQFEQTRQQLLTALNNPKTPSAVKKMDQMMLDVVDQVLIDHGQGGTAKPPTTIFA